MHFSFDAMFRVAEGKAIVLSLFCGILLIFYHPPLTMGYWHLLQWIAVFLWWYVMQRYVATGYTCDLVKPGALLLQGGQGRKVAVITGGNAGFGLATVEELVFMGCHVVMGCRRKETSLAIIEGLERKYGTKNVCIDFIPLDLSDFDSIAKFVGIFKSKKLPLHFLINNAGIMNPKFQKTKQGLESIVGTNFVGHVLLTELLMTEIAKHGTRVIQVASLASAISPYSTKDVVNFLENDLNNKAKYDGFQSYCFSKLLNIMYATNLAARFETWATDGSGPVSVSLHPGSCVTGLAGNHMPKFLTYIVTLVTSIWFGTTWRGCQNTLHCVLSPNVVNGSFYTDVGTVANHMTYPVGFVRTECLAVVDWARKQFKKYCV